MQWLARAEVLLFGIWLASGTGHTAPAGEDLGGSIEGEYAFSVVGDVDTLRVGKLRLTQGEYAYKPLAGVELPDSLQAYIEDLWFRRQPSGAYTMTYRHGIGPDTSLAELGDHEILLTLEFKGTEGQGDEGRFFFIRNALHSRRLYFDSVEYGDHNWVLSKTWK